MFDIFSKLRDLIEPQARWQTLLLLIMVLLMALLETAGVASIMPFVAVLADPSVVESNWYLSTAYEQLGFSSVHNFLLFLGAIVFLVVIGSTAFRALTSWGMVRFSSMRSYTLSRRLFEGYLDRPYAWFLGRHSADLGKTMLAEVGEVVGGALLPAMQLIAHSVVCLFVVTLLLIVDPLLAIIVSVVLGGSYAVTLWLSRKYLARIGAERLSANRQRFRITQEALAGIKDVKIMGLEQTMLRRFEKPSLRFVQRSAASKLMMQMPQYALQAIALSGILLIVQYQLVMHDGLGQSLPLIAVYAFAGYRLIPAFQRVYASVSNLRFSKPALDLLHRELLKPATGLARKTEHIRVDKSDALSLQHCLQMREVSYVYPGASLPALDGVNLSIPSRSTVGFVGKTGAGKTTAVDLILGLLEPKSGQLLVDGIAIDDDNRRAWQRCLGYVPQSIFLADDTVSANIAFGVPQSQIDAAAVERAARLANLHKFVEEELEYGYETLIGERGMRLSGGQRQRVGIARALYRDPEVLIMDEATSALDNLTERGVMDAVRNLEHRKTIVLIAHRLTTVERCDTIYLFEGGRIIASGNYAQLVDRSEQFRAMVVASVN